MHNNSSRGFTLIELLITITIIAVLSAIGLVAYGAFLKASRDARRQSDLKFIQSALEDFHSDQLYYPALLTTDSPLQFVSPSRTKIYLNKIPKDPLPPFEYSYSATGAGCNSDYPQNCTSYCLYAHMERLTSHTDDPAKCPTGDINNYGVTRP